MKVTKQQESDNSEHKQATASEEPLEATGYRKRSGDDSDLFLTGDRSDSDSPTAPARQSAPFSRSSQSDSSEAEARQTNGKRSPRMRRGLIRSLDRFAILCLKAGAFGILAALAGVATTLILQNYTNQDTIVPISEELTDQGERVAEIEGQLTSLTERVGLLAERDQVVVLVDGLQAELSALLERLVALEGSNAASGESLESAVGQLRDRLGSLGQRLRELESRLAEIEVRPASPVPSPNQGETGGDTAPPESGVVNSLAELERRLATSENWLADLRNDLQEVTGRMERLETRQPSADLSTVNRLESLSGSLKELGERLTAAEQDLTGLEFSPVGDAGSVTSMAIVAIRAAAETGAPYGRLIDDAGLSDTDLPQILMANAASGISTLGELRRGFEAAARDAIKAEGTGTDDSSVTGYLRSLVQVRPLSPRQGDSTAAILSRAVATLEAGDISSTLQLLTTLPETGKEAFSEWMEAAQARLGVMAAFDSLLEGSDN